MVFLGQSQLQDVYHHLHKLLHTVLMKIIKSDKGTRSKDMYASPLASYSIPTPPFPQAPPLLPKLLPFSSLPVSPLVPLPRLAYFLLFVCLFVCVCVCSVLSWLSAVVSLNEVRAGPRFRKEKIHACSDGKLT